MLYQIQRILLTVLSSLWNKYKLRIMGLQIGKHFITCGILFVRRYGKGRIIIGNDVNINSALKADPIGGQTYSSFVVSGNGCIHIGNKVGISNASIFSSREVIIGNETCIGGGVRIYDTDFHSSNPRYRLDGNTHVLSAPVHIGNCVFIGGGSIILKGVTIGDCAVVGAGSVVTKNIPANEVWAGNPAHFIKKIE